jgi:hypothetical protein
MKVVKLIGHGKIYQSETKQNVDTQPTGKMQQVKEKFIKSISDESVVMELDADLRDAKKLVEKAGRWSAKAKAKAINSAEKSIGQVYILPTQLFNNKNRYNIQSQTI